MNWLIVAFFYLIATFFSIKTIMYGVFEIKQKNTFGGAFVIVFSIATYVLFAVMMTLQ